MYIYFLMVDSEYPEIVTLQDRPFPDRHKVVSLLHFVCT